ncbi:MAG: RNA polymerase sigma factor RpoD, partial [Deltaproteobacteria bacterium]|nr:RNA polymerase sigma factor RpoD [Deltaproteobacteria bacterium]
MGKEIQSDEFKKLISLGEEKGFLTYDDVNDLLPSDVISSDQIDDIIMLFGEKNIDIIDTDKGEKLIVKKPTEEVVIAKEEEILGVIPSVGKTGDPVKMYLREMGFVSLLSREGEVEIAKMIEEGLRDSMDAVFGVEACIKDVVDIGVKLKSGEIRVKSVVENLEDEDGYVEEDMHRDRVLKLINKVTALDRKNDALKQKLRAKGLRESQKQSIFTEWDKNAKSMIRLCRKVKFSKKQTDRIVARLKGFLTEIENAEKAIQTCKEKTRLSLTQMEKAWTRMKKSSSEAKRVARELKVTVEKLRECETIVKEANRKIK